MAEKENNVSDEEWRRKRTTSVTLAAGFVTRFLSLPAFQQDLGACLRRSEAALQQHPPVFIPLNSTASNFAVSWNTVVLKFITS